VLKHFIRIIMVLVGNLFKLGLFLRLKEKPNKPGLSLERLKRNYG